MKFVVLAIILEIAAVAATVDAFPHALRSRLPPAHTPIPLALRDNQGLLAPANERSDSSCSDQQAEDYLAAHSDCDFFSGITSEICAYECQEQFFEYADYCNDNSGRLGYQAQCGRNSAGTYCVDARDNNNAKMSLGKAYIYCNDVETCSSECAQALQGIVDQMGCCYGNFYNNTAVGIIAAYAKVNDVTQWDSCSMEPPGICLMEEPTSTPPTEHAATTAAPTESGKGMNLT